MNQVHKMMFLDKYYKEQHDKDNKREIIPEPNNDKTPEDPTGIGKSP
jgi:hypothetical protein